jgi:putative ABC transport system ATP-binding protein
MIEFIDISKAFVHSGADRVLALKHVSLKINSGEFVTVIGTNGSGKSTFLNAISGTFRPDSGKIIIDERDCTCEPEYKRAAYIGRVFQNPFVGTSPKMTIIENLRIAELRGQPRRFRNGLRSVHRSYFRDLLKNLQMGLEDRLDANVGLLSGGQRQALTLLMATLQKPKILLLDEHTAALDPKAAEQIIRMTREIVAESQLTTVMVTHSMGQALELGTRTLMMYKGELIGDFLGQTRARMKVQDLLNRFSELRKAELLDDTLIQLYQEGYY